MKNSTQTHTVQNAFQFIDFSKASPEAIDSILEALNAEVDQAVRQNRVPTLEGAFNRLAPTTPIMM